MSAYSPSVLERLQLDMAARVAAHPYFSNVQVIVLRPRGAGSGVLIQQEIDNALSGLLTTDNAAGAAILVNMPLGDVPNEEIFGPELQLIPSARVIENPLINMGETGTGKSAEDLMLALLNLLHDWFIQEMGATMVADRQAFEPKPEFISEDKVVYDVRFRIKMNLAGPLKAPIPIMAGSATGGVTIAAATGASVYYTTDGSYPSAQNEFAQIYSGPIETESGEQIETEAGAILTIDPTPIFVASGTLVRAVAYLPNQQASDLAALKVT